MRYFLVLALLISAPYRSFGQEDISVKTIDQIKGSIVPVACAYIDEHNVFQVVGIAGSGFLVDAFGRFVTAAHVLDGLMSIAQTRHKCFPVFYIPDEKWTKFRKNFGVQYFSFTGCLRDDSLDLAVCQPRENPFTSGRVHKENIAPIAFDSTEWPDGTPVAFTGFPLEYAFPVTSKGVVAGKRAVPTSETYFDVIIDKSAWPGASGSLVYISSGRAVGLVLAAGVNSGSGLAYARSAAAIVDFLARNPYVANRDEKTHQQ